MSASTISIEDQTEKHVDIQEKASPEDIDLATFHEQHAGRLVIDPEEARIEFGEAVASRLKLSKDGTKVLWPQPSDSPLDPQNWSSRKKTLHLLIITLAAIVPDFDSGIGMSSNSVYRNAPTYMCFQGSLLYLHWRSSSIQHLIL
ncbi:hypothetical protein BDQ17DRAFT_502038 [Cyathus striatus]|nr:hypothetical protein BDQ17DRAFT_841390 [Cyathus striatus]KAF9003397.1 hypothetical protein BDQ17DRAFT_502038 [Cyathus striatus]